MHRTEPNLEKRYLFISSVGYVRLSFLQGVTITANVTVAKLIATGIAQRFGSG